VKKTPTMGQVITQQTLPFEVEPAEAPEPAVVTEVKPKEPEPEPQQETAVKEEETILTKWKNWLNNLMTVVTE